MKISDVCRAGDETLAAQATVSVDEVGFAVELNESCTVLDSRRL
jgi:hypothetical protein